MLLLRTSNLNRLYNRRTARQLFASTYILPEARFYDPVAIPPTKIIYPGMIATYTSDQLVGVANEYVVPIGIHANFINGMLDEVGQGHCAVGIWPLSSTWEILGGPNVLHSPLDHSIVWEKVQEGTPLYANYAGQFTTREGYISVGQLLDVVRHDKIIVELSDLDVLTTPYI